MSDKENIKLSIKEATIRFFLYSTNIVLSIIILPFWNFIFGSSNSNPTPYYTKIEEYNIKQKFGETNIYYDYVGNILSSLANFLPKDLSLTFIIISFLELFIIIACLRNKKFSSDHTIIILSKNISATALGLSTICTFITIMCLTLLVICGFIYSEVDGISLRSVLLPSSYMLISFISSIALLFFSKWVDEILKKATK